MFKTGETYLASWTLRSPELKDFLTRHNQGDFEDLDVLDTWPLDLAGPVPL